MLREKTSHTGNQIRIQSPLNKTLESQLAWNKSTSNGKCCIQQSCLLKLTNRDISRKAQTKAVRGHQAGGCVRARACFACACGHVCMSTCVWRPEANIRYCTWLLSTLFLGRVVSLSTWSSSQLHWLASKSSGSSCLCLPGAEIIEIIGFLVWVVRNKLQSSYLQWLSPPPQATPESCFTNLLAIEKRQATSLKPKCFFKKIQKFYCL